ncbi:MAG: DUF86 domain-containing protein [Rhizobiaceae bacterium]|nr:DUF86 domain-containing protein [Rhizobiaceae bacterium]
MSRLDSLRLADILTAIEDVRITLTGIDEQSFLHDRMRRNAVSMSILVISEAARHLSPALKAQRPDVPWRKIEDIGNILRHVYFRVEYKSLWEICVQHLEPLEAAALVLAKESSVD